MLVGPLRYILETPDTSAFRSNPAQMISHLDASGRDTDVFIYIAASRRAGSAKKPLVTTTRLLNASPE